MILRYDQGMTTPNENPRPMPGPPECLPAGFPHERTARDACLIHARSYHANSKRLKDAECDTEWDAAEQDASTVLLYHVLGDKRITAWQVERFDNAAHTWHRFATRPHALEIDGAAS